MRCRSWSELHGDEGRCKGPSFGDANSVTAWHNLLTSWCFPSGASIKYDKSGRLKPGFLPYYAVAPGASREFIPPHSPFGMDYGSGPRSHSGGRWADERDWGARGGYDPAARYYDRMEYSAHGRPPPMDFRGANPGEFPYDMRMERGYDMRGGRGGYDARGAPAYDRGAPVYDARGYDRAGYDSKWQQYEDPRGDGRYGWMPCMWRPMCWYRLLPGDGRQVTRSPVRCLFYTDMLATVNITEGTVDPARPMT